MAENNNKALNVFSSLIGKGSGPRTQSYTWRDIALYALGVGAHKEDLPYIYEKDPNFKALPTFGVTPYLNNITISPLRSVPFGPNELVLDAVDELNDHKQANRLHMAMDLKMYRPIDPMQGTFVINDRVAKVMDWGDKGVVCEAALDVADLAGNPICTCTGTHWHAACGNFGGEPFVSPKMPYPDRAPDIEVEDYISETQACVYRLSGDTYPVHIDPKTVSPKLKGPFMQGLGTFGFASRMAIQKLIPFEPERVTHLYAQMRSICYPGQTITLRGWFGEKPGVLYFKLVGEDGAVLLNNCIMEYTV